MLLNPAAFLEVDMAVLGAEPADGEAARRTARAAFLRGVLDRGKPLFHTARARDALDRQAGTNLRRELDELDP